MCVIYTNRDLMNDGSNQRRLPPAKSKVTDIDVSHKGQALCYELGQAAELNIPQIDSIFPHSLPSAACASPPVPPSRLRETRQYQVMALYSHRRHVLPRYEPRNLQVYL